MRAKSKPLAPATLNRYKSALDAVFVWAIKRRITPKGWTAPVGTATGAQPDHALPRRGRARSAACRVSQERIRQALHAGVDGDHVRCAQVGAIATALVDIDMERCEATVHESKNDEPRVLPLLPDVIDQLKRFEGAPDELVFASRRYLDRPYWFRSSWEAALRVAGIKRFRFHDLRHTCASYLAQANVDLLTISKILGHRSLRTSARYGMSTESKRATVARVLGKIGKVK